MAMARRSSRWEKARLPYTAHTADERRPGCPVPRTQPAREGQAALDRAYSRWENARLLWTARTAGERRLGCPGLRTQPVGDCQAAMDRSRNYHGIAWQQTFAAAARRRLPRRAVEFYHKAQ